MNVYREKQLIMVTSPEVKQDMGVRKAEHQCSDR